MNKRKIVITILIVSIFANIIIGMKLIFKGEQQANKITEKSQIYTDPFNSQDSLKIKIVTLGDTAAYLKLREIYIDNDKGPEFLVWSLVMSNKFHYNVAYYDVYFSFQQIDAYYYKNFNAGQLKLLDLETKKIAVDYLKKAANHGDIEAKNLVKKYYNY